MEHDIPFGNSNRENGTTFLDFPLFLGIFQWDEPTKRVPFTAEPEIPEILTKWKAPFISIHGRILAQSLSKRTFVFWTFWLKIMDFVTQTDAAEVGNNFPCRKNVLQTMVSNPFM